MVQFDKLTVQNLEGELRGCQWFCLGKVRLVNTHCEFVGKRGLNPDAAYDRNSRVGLKKGI